MPYEKQKVKRETLLNQKDDAHQRGAKKIEHTDNKSA